MKKLRGKNTHFTIENVGGYVLLKQSIGALQGVKVIDLSRVLAGPFCTMMLADLGADVIKVEIPKRGDDSRQFPPFYKGESVYYINLNRNKRSITLNLKDPRGKELFKKLVEKADVVVENFSPGTMDRLNIGYEALKKVNPRIIFASISGFGQYGPYRKRPGYDLIGQAMGGIMSITGWPDSPPTRTGTAIADVLAGMFCTIGILSALKSREKSGVGQSVDVSLVDSVFTSIENVSEMYLVDGEVPGRIGNRYEFVYPYDTFKASDGWIAIGIGNDSLWRRFCQAIDREDLIEDERCVSNAKRVENHVFVKDIVEEWTGQRTVDESYNYLLEKKVPSAPVLSIDQIVADPHIAEARQMVLEMMQPRLGPLKVIGNPIKLDKTPTSIRASAPSLGEHTDEVLETLGLNKSEILELKEAEVI